MCSTLAIARGISVTVGSVTSPSVAALEISDKLCK